MAGIRIFNDAGTIQIDQDFVSLTFVSKGSIPMVDDLQAHPQKMRTGRITVRGTTPLVAFRAPAAVNQERVTVNGDEWTFFFRAQSNSDFTLDYWIFDVASRGQGAGTLDCGLRVFREDGSLAFDAATKPMRIVSVISPPTPVEAVPARGDLSAPFGATETYTPPSGRLVAAIQGVFCFMTAMWDQGSYGTGTSPPALVELDGREPPLNGTWRYMHLESYHSTATTSASGGIRAGSERFERFEGWYPFSTAQTAQVHGQLMHWIVDVTNY